VPERSIELVSATPNDAGRIRQLAEEIWWKAYPAFLSDEQIRYMLQWMYSPTQLAAEISGGLMARAIASESVCGRMNSSDSDQLMALIPNVKKNGWLQITAGEELAFEHFDSRGKSLHRVVM